MRLKGSPEFNDLAEKYPINRKTIRYRFGWEWDRPRRYIFLGVADTGKSNTNEVFATRHPIILDMYGSKDNENLCWLRDKSPIDNILLIVGDNTDVDCSFNTIKAGDFSHKLLDKYECVTTCHSFFSSDAAKYNAIQSIADKLYNRRGWKKGHIVYLVLRETMNVIYSRTSQGIGEKDAKADLLYFIRELRHFGFSVGADMLRWTGVDKELRDLADFTIFKQIGEKGLPNEKRWIYSYIHPIVFAQMRHHQFVALRKDGALARCTNDLLDFHKEEGVDLINELGIYIVHGEEAIESTSQRVGDKEHSEICRLYLEDESMHVVSKKLKRSSQTVSSHVNYHNKSVVNLGYCPRCKRTGSDLVNVEVKVGKEPLF